MARQQIQIDGDDLLAVIDFVSNHGDDLLEMLDRVPDVLGRAGEALGSAGSAALDAGSLIASRSDVDAVDVTQYTASALDACARHLTSVSRVMARVQKRSEASMARELATSGAQVDGVVLALGEAAAGLRELGVALGGAGDRLGSVGGEINRSAVALTELRDGRPGVPQAPGRRSSTKKPTPAKRPTSKRSSAKKPTSKKRPSSKRPPSKKPKKKAAPTTRRDDGLGGGVLRQG